MLVAKDFSLRTVKYINFIKGLWPDSIVKNIYKASHWADERIKNFKVTKQRKFKFLEYKYIQIILITLKLSMIIINIQGQMGNRPLENVRNCRPIITWLLPWI